MRILLQFPEGLKSSALKEANALEKQGHEVFVSSSSCYGACDLCIEEAKAVKADKIIHYGHCEFVSESPFPVEYRHYPLDMNIEETLSPVLEHLKNHAVIGLVTTIQHVHQLGEMKAFLEKHGKTVKTAKGKLARSEAQILGCDALAATKVQGDVDAVVFFGGGFFHPLAVRTEKPFYSVDPFCKRVVLLNDLLRELERKKKAALMAALNSDSFGILVSTKIGQNNFGAAEGVKKQLEALGKTCAILVSNEINFEALRNFNSFDCFLNTACPRVWEDSARAGKPILSLDDAVELIRQLREQKH